jgi:hypothetical protein
MVGRRRIPAADDTVVAGTPLATGGTRPIMAIRLPFLSTCVLNHANAKLGVLIINGNAAVRAVF